MAGTLIKRVNEFRQYEVSFANYAEIQGGDALAVVTSVTATPTGLTVGSPSITGSGVYFTIQGGTAYQNYTIQTVVVTAAGYTLEDESVLQLQP